MTTMDNQMQDKRPFIRGQIAIESMRDNGFLSAAHALAELIDNSVQAGADCVDLIAFENRKSSGNGERAVKQIEKIGVFDNGSGMSKEILYLALEFGASKNRENSSGIGKFGMGLPNSSISQCRRVDVWSWTDEHEISHTYLDIDLILKGQLENIPYPENQKIPPEVLACLGEKLPKSGTFVLWSKIDRCQWKTGNSIYRHTQDIVGRMYRQFLAQDKIAIRFKSAELIEGIYVLGEENRFKANDPLYLLKDTSLPTLPGNFEGESFFETVDDYEFEVADEFGERQKVRIVGSIVKKAILQEIAKTTTKTVGHTDWGKHTLRNVGVSIVRSGRELALREDFLSTDMIQRGVGRWCGMEISFSPALDNILGVTNNKQHVVNLKMLKKSEDYEKEGFESEQDYLSDLRANNDPKLRIYEIIQHIEEMRSKLASRLSTLSFQGTKLKPGQSHGDTSVDDIIQIVNDRNNQREETHPTDSTDPSTDEVVETLIKGGVSKEDATETAKQIMENRLMVWIESRPMTTNAFFDVTTKKGFTLMQINENHIFTKNILAQVPPEHKQALELCLAGWARMERECQSEKRLQQLQMARRDWGQMLEDFLDDDED